MNMWITLALLAPLQTPQDPALARLESSPRHHEWVELERGARKVKSFVVFPEVKAKVPAVLVIHENKGLTDWVRSVADQLAEAGYVALAPDLLSGAGPADGDTGSFASTEAATKALYALDSAQVLGDLDALLAHARTLSACNGKVFVAGFCWGGGKSFEYATHQQELSGAFVFYGTAPKDEVLATITCPVFGFYGENDARITAGLEATTAAMKKAGKSYDPVVYAGAGHGFLRAGEAGDASAENRKARDEAWKRWRELLGHSVPSPK
ncbi:MAG: dienelactone hydrolase family protein [Planctomycetes bacterium]|nr:dienelactone hydrolase family protein [Planctomycetota bacterium]